MHTPNFYCKGRRSEQQGIYKLLVIEKKIPVETVVHIINLYGYMYNNWTLSSKQFRAYNKGGQAWELIVNLWQREVIDSIEWNFGRFLSLVSEQTGITFSQRKKAKKQNSYEDSWEINNLNGGFAYNGCTEDF